jgi:hypothetical protein
MPCGVCGEPVRPVDNWKIFVCEMWTCNNWCCRECLEKHDPDATVKYLHITCGYSGLHVFCNCCHTQQ